MQTLLVVRKSWGACPGGSWSAYQYIQPTAKPTPLSRNRRGNSITGALTGIKAVISPKQDMTDEMTVPMST